MKTSLRKAIVAAACSLSLAAASFAAPSLAAPSIDVTSLGNGAAFFTDFTYGTAHVRVTGPADYVQEFAVDSLGDLAFVLDASALDGEYRWEILAVQPIDGDLRARLEAADAAGDRGFVERLKASGELQSATFFGTFQLNGGLVEVPTKNYSASDQDIQLDVQVVSQDQVIKGSQCVGTDCENAPNFNFDTIRLKENNLRIHFEDSSSSGSFPSNDWRLLANDTNNGGANYFAIEDSTGNKTPFRVDAGAVNNTLRVATDRKIGINTASPAVNLHIVEGNTPTLRLHQDGSSGFQTQIWDIAGNETNFFVRDVTNSSLLPFRIKPNTPKNTLYLTSTGAGINVPDSGPTAPLHVRGGGSSHTPSNSAVMALFQNNNADNDGAIVSILAGNGTANAQMWFGDTDNDKAGRIIYRNGSDAMSFWTSGNERLFIEADGDICLGCNDTQGDAMRHSNGAVLTAGGTWTNASSRALKEEITELSSQDAMAALAELAPVTYRYKAQRDETYVGFIAEDVPDLVAMNDRKSLTSMDVVAVLTKVVQEQQRAIEALTERLEGQGVE